MIDHLDIESCVVPIEIEFEEDIKNRQEKEEAKTEETEFVKKANHFAFIERATQTRLFEVLETESQTDPPPM